MARQQDDDKRDRILAAALEAFGETGYATTTMKDIAARADIAPGSIYTYFQDKDELFRCTVEDAWTQFHKGMDSIFSGDRSPREKMIALIDFGFDLLRQIHPLLRGMFSEAVRQNLVGRNLDKVSLRLDRLLATPEFAPTFPSRTAEERLFFVRTTVAGILLMSALTAPEDLDQQIAAMKRQARDTYLGGSAGTGSGRPAGAAVEGGS